MEVSKRSTLMVGGQRLCRAHEAAISAKMADDARRLAARKHLGDALTKAAESLERKLIYEVRCLRAAAPSAYLSVLNGVRTKLGNDSMVAFKKAVEEQEVPFMEAAEYVIKEVLKHE